MGALFTSTAFAQSNAQPITVFPNPTLGVLIIEAPEKEKEVVIYNLLGVEIKRAELIKGEAKIDISDQPKGVYLLSVGRNTLRIKKE